MSNSNNPSFPGFLRPTTTPVPDEVFDLLMNQVSHAELRVLLYIIRRTFGFKKAEDNISLSQMVNGIKTKEGKVLDGGTGLAKSGVSKAIKGLVEKGVIVATRNSSPEKGNEPTTYALRFMSNLPLSTSEDTPCPQNGQALVHREEQALVHKMDIQQTVLQETEEQHDVVVYNQLKNFGLSDKIAAAFAKKYPAIYLTNKLVQAQALVDAKNPAGWLRKSIEEDWQPPESTTTRREKQLAILAEAEKKTANQIREKFRKNLPSEPLGEDGLTTETAWNQTLDQLKEKVTGLTFESWFKDTILLDITEGTAQVMVPSELAGEYLQRRHYSGISRTLGNIIQQDVELVFIAR